MWADDDLEIMCAYLTLLDPLQERPLYAIWPAIANKTIELLDEQADIEKKTKQSLKRHSDSWTTDYRIIWTRLV